MKQKCAKKVAYAFIFILLTLFALALAISPEIYVPVCLSAIQMWAECVLPALFPFMVITLIMIKSGVLNRASAHPLGMDDKRKIPVAAPALFVMSAFSGYPAGSRLLAEYSRSSDDKQSVKLLAPLCSTSGPLFIIGSVGQNMFADKLAGVCILVAHLISVIVVWLILCAAGKPQKSRVLPKNKDDGNLLYDCFYSAVISVIVAGGFICFFYTLSAAAENMHLLYPVQAPLSLILGKDLSSAFCMGLIEATGGCRALSACESPLSLPLSGFLITFGGASILLQQLCYLRPLGVSIVKFTATKAAQGLLCFLLLLPVAFIMQ